MAVNPATSVIATRDDAYKAVVPVDIQVAVADPSVVTANATVVYIAGGSSSGTTSVTGNVADNAVDSGNPVKVGGRYNLSAQTYADGDRADLQMDVNGRALVQSSGNVASGATDTGNPVKVAGVYRATSPTLTDGQRGDLQLGTRGSLNVTLFPANNATPGGFQVNNSDAVATTATTLAATGFGMIFNGSTWDRLKKGTTTGRIVSSAATTNATSVKASAGSVHVVMVTNTTASLKYLKLYNKASAPTVGTDTPVLTIPLQPSNVPTRVEFPNSMNFATGIALALTGAAADSDTTALAAGDVVGLNIVYD